MSIDSFLKQLDESVTIQMVASSVATFLNQEYRQQLEEFNNHQHATYSDGVSIFQVRPRHTLLEALNLFNAFLSFLDCPQRIRLVVGSSKRFEVEDAG